MQENSLSYPRRLALFEKRFEGDDALLRLAELRFREAGLGTEFYAETREQLDRLLSFKPGSNAPATVHLPREVDLLQAQGRRMVIDFAEIFRNRLYGLVVHDQPEVNTRFADFLAVLGELDSRLCQIKGSPYLFVEYASGLDLELFVKLFRRLRGTGFISACVDTGHIGLKQVGAVYSQMLPGKDIFSLNPGSAQLIDVVGSVQTAVQSALEGLLGVIRELGPMGKPLHFHLHDGHPLYALSPFGIRDHLSFLTEVPIPFDYQGKRALQTMYGPSGLRRILSESLALSSPELLSFSFEIHPTEGRIPLGGASHIFRHWIDKTNAERMNYWLSVVAQNLMLISDICEVHNSRRK